MSSGVVNGLHETHEPHECNISGPGKPKCVMVQKSSLSDIFQQKSNLKVLDFCR